MVKLKLSYFDFNGGRGEPARLAMFIAGISFEDCRIPFSAWPATRDQMPFRAVPVLEVDGKMISQSNTINRYIGRLTNLYPEDPWQAALCDEILDAIEDISTTVASTLKIADEAEKKATREALCSGAIPLYLTRLQAYLEDRGGKFYSDYRLTIADLKVFVWLRHLLSGVLDYIPTGLVAQHSPKLLAFFERINSHPKIVEYYASH